MKKRWEITDETQARFSIKVIRKTGTQQSEQEKEIGTVGMARCFTL